MHPKDVKSKDNTTVCGPQLDKMCSKDSGKMFTPEDSLLLVSVWEVALQLSVLLTSTQPKSSRILK